MSVQVGPESVQAALQTEALDSPSSDLWLTTNPGQHTESNYVTRFQLAIMTEGPRVLTGRNE